MRIPIKFNREYLSHPFTKLLPAADDPRILSREPISENSFSKAISAFKFDTTFKTTQKARFPLTIAELAPLLYHCTPVILDVGASDGTTSLDVIGSLRFQRYYVTDLNLEVRYRASGNYTYFYDENDKCILIVSDAWVAYSDLEGAIFPFGALGQYFFRRAPRAKEDLPRLMLINPALHKMNDKTIQVERYNVFDRWRFEKVDLVIAANLLNRSYFSDSEIRKALNNIINALNDMGRVAIIDNRKVEKATIFQFRAGLLSAEQRINGGTEIEDLVLNTSA